MQLAYIHGPKQDESGLGYYRRLSAANALWNWRELARMADVSPSRTGILGRPDHMAAALGIDQRWTEQAFKQEEEARRWRGLHRTGHDAVCPECLKEACYLRSHWEHGYVVACSHHGKRLVDRCSSCAEMLSTARERIEQCRCGQDLRNLQSVSASSAELWLVALFASKGSTTLGQQPALEHVGTDALSKLVRTLCILADPETPNARRNAAAPKSVDEAVEFLHPLNDLLADWPSGFEAHVSRRIAAGDAQARTLNSLLGRWYQQLKAVSADGSLKPFMASVMKVAQSEFDGLIGLDTAGDVAAENKDHMLLKEAAAILGVSKGRLVSCVTSGELRHRTRRFGTRGVTYEIPTSEVEETRASRSRWMSDAQACELLGVPLGVLSQIVAANLVTADARWRSDIQKSGPIERASVKGLMAALTTHVRKSKEDGECITLRELTSRRMGDKKAIQAALTAIASGEIQCVGASPQIGGFQYRLSDIKQYFGTPVLESGLSLHQLSKLTGWKWESVDHWVNSGLLETQSIVLRGQSCRVVSPQQLIEFRQTFVPLADLAKAMGTKSSSLAERLVGIDLVGAKPLPNGGRRGGLIRLADLGRLALSSMGDTDA